MLSVRYGSIAIVCNTIMFMVLCSYTEYLEKRINIQYIFYHDCSKNNASYWLVPWCQTDADAMAVEQSHQYSITFCCCATDGNRGAIWQNGTWKYASRKDVLFFQRRKSSTPWYSLGLTESLWRQNSGCEHSEAIGGAFQQWWLWLWVPSTGTDFYKCAIQALVHHWWKCTATGGDYVEK